MSFNANSVFNENAERISEMIGVPKSSELFTELFIVPAQGRSRKEGPDIEDAYHAAMYDYQHRGFIVGFNVAVQFLARCASGDVGE